MALEEVDDMTEVEFRADVVAFRAIAELVGKSVEVVGQLLELAIVDDVLITLLVIVEFLIIKAIVLVLFTPLEVVVTTLEELTLSTGISSPG